MLDQVVYNNKASFVMQKDRDNMRHPKVICSL